MKMTKPALILAAGAAAVALSACGQRNDGGAPDQSNEAVNAAQDAASTAVGAAAAQAGAATAEGFVSNAAIANMYEIEAARMALQRSNNARVKAIAQTIVDDHTKAGADLRAAASGMTLPTALDERHKGLIDNLRGASNENFDRVYLEQQQAAHREAVDLFSGYADGGDNASLKAFAAKTLPALRSHLEMVNGAMGGQ